VIRSGSLVYLCGRDVFCLADDLHQAPGLRLAYWARFSDAHDISDMGLIGLVVGVKLALLSHPLLVERVLYDILDGDDDGFIHLVADDMSGLGLDLTGHLCLPLSFRQNRQDPGDLPLCFIQSMCILGLPRGKAEAYSRKIGLGLL
jgi:hypothetical protein